MLQYLNIRYLNNVIRTLNETITKRKDVSGVIINSDQGFQYTYYE